MKRARRVRLARGLDETELRSIFSTELHGNAKVELVFADGSRHRVSRGQDGAALRLLKELTTPGSDARLELVLDTAG